MTGLLKVPKKPRPKKIPQSGLLHLSLYHISCTKLANFGSMMDKQGNTHYCNNTHYNNTHYYNNTNTNTNNDRSRFDY